jgi:hypothetical protein
VPKRAAFSTADIPPFADGARLSDGRARTSAWLRAMAKCAVTVTGHGLSVSTVRDRVLNTPVVALSSPVDLDGRRAAGRAWPARPAIDPGDVTEVLGVTRA